MVRLFVSTILIAVLIWGFIPQRVCAQYPEVVDSCAMDRIDSSLAKATFSLRYLYWYYFDKPRLAVIADSLAKSLESLNDSLKIAGDSQVVTMLPILDHERMISLLFPGGDPVHVTPQGDPFMVVRMYGMVYRESAVRYFWLCCDEEGVGILLHQLPMLCGIPCVDSIQPGRFPSYMR